MQGCAPKLQWNCIQTMGRHSRGEMPVLMDMSSFKVILNMIIYLY